MTVSFNTTTSQMMALCSPLLCWAGWEPWRTCSVHWLQSSALTSSFRVIRFTIVEKRQLETLETCVTQTDAQFFVNICKNNKRRFDLQIKFIYKKQNCFNKIFCFENSKCKNNLVLVCLVESEIKLIMFVSGTPPVHPASPSLTQFVVFDQQTLSTLAPIKEPGGDLTL